LLNILIRFSLAAGIFMTFSTATIDQSQESVQQIVQLAGEAQSAGVETRSRESLRPSEIKAIGNYLKTPSLYEVYPGLKVLARIDFRDGN
jgi:hypothetical protein